jgi:leader peptidase (prepilin peptidase)/N-methyltransferase
VEPEPVRTSEEIAAAARRSPRLLFAAGLLAVALGVATIVHYGLSANGVAWAAVQVLLVFIAWFDVQERRILNVVVGPAVVAVIALRLAFERDALLECVLAGVVAFAVFTAFAAIVRGGLGMGDVKLAGLIGVLLGQDALYALMLGVVLGGLAAVAILATRTGTRKSAYAYGPYLALGAAIWIVIGHPPALV